MRLAGFGVRQAVLVGGSAALVGACTLLTDLSGLSGVDDGNPSDGGLDDRSSDAPTIDDAAVEASPEASTDGGTDSGPATNSCGALLFGQRVPMFNDGFELGCANGWTTYAATADTQTTFVSEGSIACVTCSTGGIDGYFIFRGENLTARVGENYEVVACVRSTASGVATPVHVEVGATVGGNVPSTSSFAAVRAGYDVTADRTSLDLRIRSPIQDAGSCFIVDDVRLMRVRDAGP